MSTLDKLKRSLNLTGASKGLETINAAAKNNNMHVLGNAAETVGLKFSAMYSMADQYFRNLETRIETTARRMVSALTIDPIKTGFQEYETQINAVQTILANTSHAGTTIDQVNDALNTLNTYADKTIYNFTEMTRNIGTFTAAGVDLQTSVDSIQGIANLAAVSGSTSQQASTAMYQLSQALAAGKVSLMDWNSVVNAGMGGKVFQDALVRTSELLKTGAKDAIASYGSFRESLTKGEWLTTEVLTETLKQFAGAYSEADLIAQGFTAQQAKDIAAMAKTAEDAATKVKTFTQLWDVLKESAQSGWSQTWKLIIGDFEEAKSLLTPLADFLTGAINSFSEARNKLLESALGKGFTHMYEGINSVMKTMKNGIDAVADPIKNTTAALEGLDEIVGKVIHGDFGNGADRLKALTEAGQNYYRVQNKVNEALGNSFRYSEEKIAQQDKLLTGQKETTEKTGEQETATVKLTKAEITRLTALTKLTDEQLKSKGYGEEQIETIREIEKQADKLGMTTGEFLTNLDQINGRWLLIQSFKNVGSGLVSVFKAIGDAWKGIFDATDEEKANRLFDILAGIHKFSTNFVMSKETADNLTRTFKGLFAIVDVLATVLGGGLRIAFKMVSSVLGYFNLDILDVTARVGDALVAFRDWFDGLFDITGILDIIVPVIDTIIGKFETWFDVMKTSTEFGRFAQALGVLADHISSFISGFKNLESIKDIPKYIVEGLINGLADEAKNIWNAFVEFAKVAIESFCETMGIHSPSTVFFEFGQNIVQGLVNGIAAAMNWAINGIKNLGSGIINFFKGIDFSGLGEGFESSIEKVKQAFDNIKKKFEGFDYKNLLAIIPIGAVLFMVKKIYDIASSLADGIDSFNDVLEGLADIEKQFANVLKSFSQNMKSKALKNVAISIAILVGAIVVLALIPTDRLDHAVGVIVILAGTLALLAWAMGKMSSASIKIDKESKGINIDGLKSSLVSIGIAMLLLAATVKLVGSMNPEEAKQGFLGLAGILGALLIAMGVFGVLAKFDMTKDIDKIGGLCIKMAIALALMVGVCKLVNKLSEDEMIHAAKFAGGFLVFVGILVAVSKVGSGKSIDGVGGLILKIAIAMGLMVGVCKLANLLSESEMIHAAKFAGGFLVFVGVLVAVTKIGSDKQIAKLGGLLLSISLSLILMVGVCKLVGMLEPSEMGKGVLFLGGFLAFIFLLTKVTTITKGQQTAKLAGTILAVSIAIGILAGIAILLSMVPVEGLVNGVLVVTIFGVMLAGLILATRGAEKVVGNLIVMTVAIGILVAGVAVLSTLDPGKLAGATAAITIVLGMFTLLVKAAGTCQGAIGPLLIMTLAVGLIGGLIYLIAQLPVENAIGAAASIAILLLAMSASMVIIGTFGGICKTGLIALGVMTLVVGILAGILWKIQDLPVESTMINVLALSTLLMALSAACIILELAGLAGPAALWGVAALAALIVGIGGLIATIGALVTEFPKLEEFLNTGIPIIEKIGTAIGSFFGNIISGFAEGVTSTLPSIGESLSAFMDNLSGFISGAKTIDEEAITGVKNLAEMMVLISGASIVDKIASMFGDESSMTTFSASLGAFADAIVAFSTKVKGNIDESSVLAAASAGKMLAEMQSTIPGTGGIIQWFCGEKNFETFATGLKAFGSAIVEFSKVVGVDGAINETAITAAANAGKMMAEMQSNIVGTGGVVQWFCGEKDFTTFGTGLVAFGKALVEFSGVVGAEGAINESAIQSAASMGTLMTELQSSLEPTDGIMQWLAGEKNFETFGSQLKAFGTALVDFSKTVSAEGAVSTEAIESAANAGKMMAAVQAAIPEDKWLDGKISIDDFGEKIVSFGESIADYSETVADVDTSAVGTSITQANRLANLARSIVDLDTTGIELFKKVKTIGSTIKTYSEKVSEVNVSAISNSVSSAKKIVGLINSLAGIDTSGVKSFKSAVTDLSKISFNGIEEAFSGAGSKLSKIGSNMIDSLVKGMKVKQTSLTAAVITMSSAMQKAWMGKLDMFVNTGMYLITGFITGIQSKNSAVRSAAMGSLNSAVSGMRGYYSSFYSAGAYLVSGFAAGISANTYQAEAQATAMAKAAATAAKNALKINSPSKVFRAIGYSIPEGLANGIEKMSRLVSTASAYMTDVALQDVKDSVSRISDMIDFDTNTQPTIRPVLDLTNVKEGASSISSLFNGSPSIGVSSNLRSISSMMSNQNGVNNADVVSAIKDLKSEIGKIQGNTNIIEGITYGDDSNITNAVQSLVRAATIERRI